MGYFNFYIIKKIINSLFRYIRKNKIFIIIFIIFVCILFIGEKCFAVTVNPTYDASENILQRTIDKQNSLVFFLYPPFYGNTEMWTDIFLPLFQQVNSDGYWLIVDDYNNNNNNTNITTITIYLVKDRNSTTTAYSSSTLTGETVTIEGYVFNNAEKHVITYYHDTNSAIETTSTTTYTCPAIVARYKSPALLELENLIARREAGLTEDYSLILNQMSQYLDDLNDINTQLLSTINSFTATLNQISSNTSTNYSQQIGQISNKISDLLTDNDTIISQNSQMLQEQQEINDNLEDVNDSVQELKNTITDDTVESGASDLPSTDVSNPTETGIDNIFSSIYNAFCVGQAQDIVFPIPFTDKNITLSPYYVSDMLNNNGAAWVYTLIQAFWGYLIGRFIISDISKKIDKIKSGNIENVENSNIKEEML